MLTPQTEDPIMQEDNIYEVARVIGVDTVIKNRGICGCAWLRI